MQIIYQDEYGSGVYWGQSSHPANIGDSVIVGDEEYYVKSRVFFPKDDKIIITVTQNPIRPGKETKDDTGGRLAEMSRAIIAVNKKQDSSEKKGRMLTEQVVTIRKHINQRIQQERKES